MYTGQCHAGSWDFFTIDARDPGGSAINIVSQEAPGLSICGHSNTEKMPDDNGFLIWCGIDLGNEWADVTVPVSGT